MPISSLALPLAAIVATASPGPVVITSDTTISANDRTWDGLPLVIDGAVVTIETDPAAPHVFASLGLVNGAIINHPWEDPAGLVLEIDGDVSVDDTSFFDLTGAGHGPAGGPSPGGAGSRAGGGGHAGAGGSGTTAGTGSFVSGDLHTLDTLGSGGGIANNESTSGRGGGLVWLNVAGDLHVDGVIRADGQWAPTGRAGAGAGGTVLLEVQGAVTGSGSVRADGGGSYEGGAGGGGRVVIQSPRVAPELEVIARGGVSSSAVEGGAGIVLLRRGVGQDLLRIVGQAGNPWTLLTGTHVVDGDIVITGGAWWARRTWFPS